MDRQDFIIFFGITGGGWEFFSSPPRSDRLWGSAAFVSGRKKSWHQGR